MKSDTLRHHLHKSLMLLLGLGLLAGLAAPALAWELQGTKTIVAHTRDQRQITLGTVRFTPGADGQSAFAVDMTTANFTEFFLSM